jgi:hypothetical protein
VPIASVAAFVALYAVAAALYPGGTRADHTTEGFSFARNYWCDLFDTTAIDGRPNPARAVALTATLILAFGLGVLWWSAPALFVESPRRAHLVRLSGIVSAAVTPLIGTRHHDLAIHLAAISGLTGYVATSTALARKRTTPRPLNALSWGTLVIVLANYFVWQTGVGRPALALIQKGAFVTFLAWMVFVALRLRRVTRASR